MRLVVSVMVHSLHAVSSVLLRNVSQEPVPGLRILKLKYVAAGELAMERMRTLVILPMSARFSDLFVRLSPYVVVVTRTASCVCVCIDCVVVWAVPPKNSMSKRYVLFVPTTGLVALKMKSRNPFVAIVDPSVLARIVLPPSAFVTT